MELLCKGCISQPNNFLWHFGRLPAYNYVLWTKYLQIYISDEANSTAAVYFKNNRLGFRPKGNMDESNPRQLNCVQLSAAVSVWPELRRNAISSSKERERLWDSVSLAAA